MFTLFFMMFLSFSAPVGDDHLQMASGGKCQCIGIGRGDTGVTIDVPLSISRARRPARNP